MKINKKLLTLICIFLVVILASAAITIAYLNNKSNAVTNTFVDGTVGCDVQENLNTPGVKKDVKLKNTGTFDAYMRAYVAINWVDASGNVYGEAPKAGTDYTVETPTPFGFVSDGNYYYCKTAVKPGETSPVLFTSIAPVEGKAPDGYILSVEILGTAIQAAPDGVVEEAWGVNVSSNTITLD